MYKVRPVTQARFQRSRQFRFTLRVAEIAGSYYAQAARLREHALSEQSRAMWLMLQGGEEQVAKDVSEYALNMLQRAEKMEAYAWDMAAHDAYNEVNRA